MPRWQAEPFDDALEMLCAPPLCPLGLSLGFDLQGGLGLVADCSAAGGEGFEFDSSLPGLCGLMQ